MKRMRWSGFNPIPRKMTSAQTSEVNANIPKCFQGKKFRDLAKEWDLKQRAHAATKGERDCENPNAPANMMCSTDWRGGATASCSGKVFSMRTGDEWDECIQNPAQVQQHAHRQYYELCDDWRLSIIERYQPRKFPDKWDHVNALAVWDKHREGCTGVWTAAQLGLELDKVQKFMLKENRKLRKALVR